MRAAGRIAEHWPPADVDGASVHWASVTASPAGARGPSGSCTSGTYPTRQDAACIAAPDGYCELADLHGYETNDGACLTYAGQTWDHLFYRSGGSQLELPIVATQVVGQRSRDLTNTAAGSENRGALEVTNRALREPIGGLYYVRRNEIGSDAPVLAARVDTPALRQSATFPAPNAETTAVIRAELAGLLRTGGLTEAEANAFERAWFSELFENGQTGGAPLVRDSLLYVLPQSELDAVSRLDFDPAPTVIKRVFWVRMVL